MFSLTVSALILSLVSFAQAVPPPPAPIHHEDCRDAAGNVVECRGSLAAWIISVSIAGVIVIGIIIALTYPKCKRRIQAKKALKASGGSTQVYQRLDDPAENTGAKMGDTQHNPDAPYDPPVNSMPYSYPSGYAPPEVSYEYKLPSQQPSSNAEPVQFPTAQTTASTTYEPPSYEPPTYAPRPAA